MGAFMTPNFAILVFVITFFIWYDSRALKEVPESLEKDGFNPPPENVGGSGVFGGFQKPPKLKTPETPENPRPQKFGGFRGFFGVSESFGGFRGFFMMNFWIFEAFFKKLRILKPKNVSFEEGFSSKYL